MAEVALAWLVGRPSVTSVILGARTVAQLEENLKAASAEAQRRRDRNARRAERAADHRLSLWRRRHQAAHSPHRRRPRALTRALQVRVTGIVQGVGYRAWAEQAARARRLSGWVRNCRDGSVEAVIAGDDAAIDEMLAAFLWSARRAARSTRLSPGQRICRSQVSGASYGLTSPGVFNNAFVGAVGTASFANALGHHICVGQRSRERPKVKDSKA